MGRKKSELLTLKKEFFEIYKESREEGVIERDIYWAKLMGVSITTMKNWLQDYNHPYRKEKKMKVLITSGSTASMIDKVRVISNIFKGNTGYNLAMHFDYEGDDVTFLTSNKDHCTDAVVRSRNIRGITYHTYDGLYESMRKLITEEDFDVIIHSAAVSDYRVAGTFVEMGDELIELESNGKIGSDYSELYLKLVPTEKIVDRIRDSWGFKGKLVKFKLQVDMSDKELLEIAQNSRKHSKANIIVANCLEWSRTKAFLCWGNKHEEVKRSELPQKLRNKIFEVKR